MNTILTRLVQAGAAVAALTLLVACGSSSTPDVDGALSSLSSAASAVSSAAEAAQSSLAAVPTELPSTTPTVPSTDDARVELLCTTIRGAADVGADAANPDAVANQISTLKVLLPGLGGGDAIWATIDADTTRTCPADRTALVTALGLPDLASIQNA